MRNDSGGTGYECGSCGYSPTERELQEGTCPGCYEDRQHARRQLEAILPTLCVGSSVQVLSAGASRYGNVARTLQLWTAVGCHEDGALKWECAPYGKVTFLDSDRVERTVWSNGLDGVSRRYTHDRASSVIHFTLGEMTYGAWYVVHNIRPTNRNLAHERLNDYLTREPAHAF